MKKVKKVKFKFLIWNFILIKLIYTQFFRHRYIKQNWLNLSSKKEFFG